MSEKMIGFDEGEPSAKHSAIAVVDVRERLPRLKKKLEEYKRRVDEAGLGFMHPDLLALNGGLYALFKPAILESIIELADAKAEGEDVYLHEVALLVQDKTEISVSRAATIPFVYGAQYRDFRPDFPRLSQEATQGDTYFSEAYAIIRGYCSGDERSIRGGTGLPEA